MRHVGPGQRLHDRRQPGARASQELQHLHQAGSGVEGGQESREDETTVGAGGEADPRF